MVYLFVFIALLNGTLQASPRVSSHSVVSINTSSPHQVNQKTHPRLLSLNVQRIFYASFFATDFNIQYVAESILKMESEINRQEFRDRLLKKNLMNRHQATDQDVERLLTTISDYYQDLVTRDLQILQSVGSRDDIQHFQTELADFERALASKISDFQRQTPKMDSKHRAGFIAVMFVVALAGAALMATGGIGVLIGISFTLIGGMGSLGEVVSWLTEETNAKKSHYLVSGETQRATLYEKLALRLKNINTMVQRRMP